MVLSKNVTSNVLWRPQNEMVSKHPGHSLYSWKSIFQNVWWWCNRFGGLTRHYMNMEGSLITFQPLSFTGIPNVSCKERYVYVALPVKFFSFEWDCVGNDELGPVTSAVLI